MDLEKLRTEIDDTDTMILELIKKRTEIAEEIGKYKITNDIPIRNVPVEENVVKKYKNFAERNDINPSTVEIICRALIQESVEKQTALPHSELQLKNISIIGGAGKMGKWIFDLLTNVGHKVNIIDPSLNNGLTIKDTKTSDVVIVSVPISAVNDILNELDDICKKDALIFDIASLKSPIVKTLKRMAKIRKICSIHPMFGPSARSMYNRNLIICDCGNSEAVSEAKILFDNKGANIRLMDLDSHDDYMSYVLGLSHAVNIAFFTVLERSGYSFDDMCSVASTTFIKNMETNRSVASEDPRLYYDIQHLNINRDKLWSLFSDAIKDLKKASLDGNPTRFIELMDLGKAYFKD